jgi:membrane fusion protein, copper/silver efflux system
MNKLLIGGIAVVAVLSATFAVQRSRKAAPVAVLPGAVMVATGSTRKVLYWKAPDGSNDFSAEPKKAADGRDYLAVYDDQEVDFAKPQGAAAAPKGKGKILYYRNPMGLADTSPVPKKDWMGMDYIAVTEGEEEGRSTVRVSLDKVQRSGVRTAPVEMRRLDRPVRVPGVVRVDERRLRVVTLRADGYIEKLHVNVTGQQVKAGEPLFRFFSPQIISAGIDYNLAVKTAALQSRDEAEGYRRIVEQRLRNLDVPETILAELRAKGRIPQTFDMPSPVSGVVLEKKVIEGMRMKAGDELFRIADVSSVWVIAEVPEQSLGQIEIGQLASVSFRAYPTLKVDGPVTFIAPDLEKATRAAKVRIEIPNKDGKLRAEMYADVEISSGGNAADRLVVPTSALIDSGNRQVVIIDRGEGRFESRAVRVGVRGGLRCGRDGYGSERRRFQGGHHADRVGFVRFSGQ